MGSRPAPVLLFYGPKRPHKPKDPTKPQDLPWASEPESRMRMLVMRCFESGTIAVFKLDWPLAHGDLET